MTWSTWWLFVVMTFFVSATPGPNMLYVMTTSARFGVGAAVRAMAGCMTALLAMMSLSAAGLGAMLQSFPAVFDTLRLAGAAYLAYLGVKCWNTPTQPASQSETDYPDESSNDGESPAEVFRRAYRQGFLVAASNPKAILFAAAFFPQFIRIEQPQLPQFAILLMTFTAIEIAWYFVYALSGDRLSMYLQRPRVLRWFNRVTGGVFVGFAGLMATARDV